MAGQRIGYVRVSTVAQTVDQQHLVREPAVDGADPDPRVVGYVVERDPHPLLGEQLPGRVEDSLPVALRVLSQRTLGGLGLGHREKV